MLTPQQGGIALGTSPVIPGSFHPEIGLVFQNADDQLFCPTVAADIAFGPTEMGLSPEQIHHRVDQALDATGVAHLADLPPHQLSGGQKRMVAIAGILACQPHITLYDEPSANLDAPARNRLIDFLKHSTQPQPGSLDTGLIDTGLIDKGFIDKGFIDKGFIVSSHDLSFVRAVCNRVMLLSGGQIMADGDPKMVLGDRHLMETYGMEPQHF